MDRFMDVEARFLMADEMITRGEIADAKAILIRIIEDEPAFGQAHNHLGWIYWTKLSDYNKAALHLDLAVKFSPEYPGGFHNCCWVAYEMGDFAKVFEVAEKGLKVKGVNKANFYRVMAYAKEVSGELKAAVGLMEKAISFTTDNEMLDVFTKDIKRMNSKMGTLRRFSNILTF